MEKPRLPGLPDLPPCMLGVGLGVAVADKEGVWGGGSAPGAKPQGGLREANSRWWQGTGDCGCGCDFTLPALGKHNPILPAQIGQAQFTFPPPM